MIGNGYWSTGITVDWIDRDTYPWGVKLSFYDDGFADDDAAAGRVATEGQLRCRYYVADLGAALDVLIADARRMGIEFRQTAGTGPDLYSECGDTASLPEEVQDEMARQAERLGWTTLARRSDQPAAVTDSAPATTREAADS